MRRLRRYRPSGHEAVFSCPRHGLAGGRGLCLGAGSGRALASPACCTPELHDARAPEYEGEYRSEQRRRQHGHGEGEPAAPDQEGYVDRMHILGDEDDQHEASDGGDARPNPGGARPGAGQRRGSRGGASDIGWYRKIRMAFHDGLGAMDSAHDGHGNPFGCSCRSGRHLKWDVVDSGYRQSTRPSGRSDSGNSGHVKPGSGLDPDVLESRQTRARRDCRRRDHPVHCRNVAPPARRCPKPSTAWEPTPPTGSPSSRSP